MTTASAHPIDIGIFVVFLVVNLIVGLRCSRSVKTIRDYALGGKNFSTSTLAATIVATWLGGDAIFYIITNVYKGGMYFIIPIVCWTVCILITGQLAARMGEFLDAVSVAEVMRRLYGEQAQIITAIFGVLSCVGCVAIQLKVISVVITLIWGVAGIWITILASIIVITYSAFGGIKAVTYTDVFQFLAFGVFIPITALVIWHSLRLDSHHVVMATLTQSPVFNLQKVIGWHPKFLGSVALACFFLIPSIDPAIFQRIAMGRDVKQTHVAFNHAAFPFLLILLSMIWIGILLLSADDGLLPNDLVHYIVDQYAYPGLRGLLGVGILAMAMSTSDSYINASAVLLSNDLAKKFNLFTKDPISSTRLFAVVCGGGGLLLALHTEDLLELALLPGSFYMPVVTVPLLLAIFRFRSSTRTVLLGMTFGFTATLFWKLFMQHMVINSIFTGMLANLIGLMGSHYLLGEPGGWQQAAPGSPLALARTARRQAWQRRIRAIRAFRLYPYLQKNIPAQESFYFFFGLYTIAATYAAFYTIGNADVQAYRPMYTGIYHAVFPLTTAFLTLPIWPSALKSPRFIAFFWPFGIGFVLFFSGALLALISHFHYTQVMIMMINTLMAVLLLRWPLALFLAFTGIALAASFFKWYTGCALPLSTLGSLHIIYLLLLFTCLLIALKGRQAYLGLVTSYARLREDNSFASQILLTTFRCRARLHQEASIYPAEAWMRARQHSDPWHYRRDRAITKEELLADNAMLQQHTYKLDVLNKHLSQILHLAQEPVQIVVAYTALEALWQEVLKTLYQNNKKNKVITRYDTTCKAIQADVAKIRRLLLAALSYAAAQRHSQTPILLGIEDTLLAYPIMSLSGYVKKVKAVRMTITTARDLPALSKFYVGNVDQAALQWPQDMHELSLTYNQQIVDAHYGFSEIKKNATGATQVYVIPCDVREVRPPTMDVWNVTPPTEVIETKMHPLEDAFMKQVHAKRHLDTQLLQEAVQLIKQCYGVGEKYSGATLFINAIAVAQILLDYTQDTDVILAALLHNTVDVSALSLHQIALRFNPVVQRIVDGVSHVDSRFRSFKKLQLSAYEKLRKLLEAKDERILYVKLAERLHIMRTLQAKPYEDQRSTATGTLLFFVPLSEKLGLVGIAKELKERCFTVLNGKVAASREVVR
ncbi:MAG: sodium:solute symporter family protein [Bacteroidota bacterium]